MANPTRKIMPEDAKRLVRLSSARPSDYPNQVNNVLAFPGIFRGALDVRAKRITNKMKLEPPTRWRSDRVRERGACASLTAGSRRGAEGGGAGGEGVCGGVRWWCGGCSFRTLLNHRIISARSHVLNATLRVSRK